MIRSDTPRLRTRPEVELLLLCTRTHVDSDTAARIETLTQENIDWGYLLKTAQEHGVTPLLYWNLIETCPEAVPESTLDQLQSYFRKNAQRNVFMAGELLRLLNLFETRGISAIPFKGPSLAASIYGNLALRRQSDDLDILIHEKDVLKARDLLLSQGYQPEDKWTRRQETVLFQASHEYTFVHYSKRLKVELHWKITSKYFDIFPEPERLWERIMPSSLAGKEVMVFSPEDLLLILCVHGTTHLWQQLELICGVAELISADKGLDWEQVMEEAREVGGERMLFLGLFLANELLGAPLPDEVLRRVQADPPSKALAAQVHERLFHEVYSPSPGVFESSLFYLRTRERLQDKVRYCMLLAMSPTEYELAALPQLASLSFFYHIIRPIRLLTGKYGLLGLLRRFL
jgi:hypothetical protein